MKLKWIPVTKQPVPVDTKVIITDGAEICYAICKFVRGGVGRWNKLTPTPSWVSIEVLGSFDSEYGGEAECTFEFNNITHWIDMSGLELPR